MDIKDIIDKIKFIAKECGMHLETKGRIKQNAVWRNNTKEISSDTNSYFGIIREGEAPSQGYSDISLVFFPNYEDKSKLLMCLGVGSEGFKNDYELASKPGLRRSFLKLLPTRKASFCKPSFTDINSAIDFDVPDYSIAKYDKVLLIGMEVDPDNESDMKLINGWIAKYAEIRGWGTNEKIRKKIGRYITLARDLVRENSNYKDPQVEVKDLLQIRKYVILEGAPGVGKTHIATKIAKEEFKSENVFFTQFHAGTTYANFVYGLLPKLNSENVVYEAIEGVFLKAIQKAQENTKNQNNDNVLLIIDEINRANLASVLGEIFYLFEPKREIAPEFSVKVGNLDLKEMPKNLFVLGTMNTADRSIAVVDYALRRRFAWYKIEPVPFPGLITEAKELFDEMSRIFETYASDMELNLQPGASYFMGSDLDEIKNRLRFELMPLIKEYILNGFMTQAEQSLDDYFFKHLNLRIFN